MCEKALRYALEIDDTVSKAFAEFVHGTLYVHKGDGKEAAEHLQKCIRYQEEKELIPLTGVAWTHLGLAHYLMGDMETARTRLDSGLEILSLPRCSIVSHIVWYSPPTSKTTISVVGCNLVWWDVNVNADV